MKSVFRYLTLLFLFVSVSFFIFSTSTATRTAAYSDFERTYLIAGFDDSSWHTDVMALVNYKSRSNQVSIFQIPRDTFFNFGKSQNKINQLTATAIFEGESPKDAMNDLKDSVQSNLGIVIDGFVAVTTDAFANIIETVGGVNVKSEKNTIFYGRNGQIVLSIKEGENHLTPEQALNFVRYRSGYLRGDLDRLEAQKLFFDGFFRTVLQKSNPIALLGTLLKTQGLFTDITFSDIISFAPFINNVRDSYIVSFTLPGEAIKSQSGVWYYALDRKANIELLSKYFSVSEKNFDTKRKFDIPTNFI